MNPHADLGGTCGSCDPASFCLCEVVSSATGSVYSTSSQPGSSGISCNTAIDPALLELGFGLEEPLGPTILLRNAAIRSGRWNNSPSLNEQLKPTDYHGEAGHRHQLLRSQGRTQQFRSAPGRQFRGSIHNHPGTQHALMPQGYEPDHYHLSRQTSTCRHNEWYMENVHQEAESIDSLALGTQFSLGHQDHDDEDIDSQLPATATPNEHHVQFMDVLFNRNDGPIEAINQYVVNIAEGTRLPSSVASSWSDNRSIPGDGWECPICKKRYRLKSSLRKHERTHDPSFIQPRPHLCGTCNLPFQYRKDRGRHELTHEPARPYKCQALQCRNNQIGFKRNDHLLRHIRSQHTVAQTLPTS